MSLSFTTGKGGKVATNTVIYRSHVVPQCLNPTWTFSGMTATDEAISHFSAESKLGSFQSSMDFVQ